MANTRSYSKTKLGRAVAKLPQNLQPFVFMIIQYLYSITTMLPCSLWYNNKLYSTAFLALIFGWSVWNGASYYIDVFGRRFQKELEALRQQLAETPTNSGSSSALSR